jgi:hypothetical protein
MSHVSQTLLSISAHPRRMNDSMVQSRMVLGAENA